MQGSEEPRCECGHPRSSHNSRKEVELDPTLLSDRPIGNIYAGEARGKTKCSECDCLNYRPKQ